MRPDRPTQEDSAKRRREDAQVGLRILLVAALSVLLGLGIGALLSSRRAAPRPPGTTAEPSGQDARMLSAGTLALLEGLKAPVQIKYYALLDSATVPEEVTRMAGRVEELLAAYRRESGGKITVSIHRSRSEVSAAAADGMKPFNLDKGDVCYVGLTVAQGGKRELIPRFFPEWEQAFESDISRAISRVLSPAASAPAAAVPPLADAAVIEDVKRRIPNYASVSLDEGSRILRESALKELQAALSQGVVQLKEAEQRLAQLAETKSEAERQAALQELQRLQAEQAAKLRDITTRSSAQIEALRQIKESAR